MPEPNNVLDVLTVKRGDNRPTLEMSLAEINQAVEQPTDDAAWDKYTAEELSAGNRHELHMDWYDSAADETVRVVDGREAIWDGTTEEISIQLQRSDVSREGEYYFEWVVIYDAPDADGNVPTSATADEVNTIPSRGFFNLSVEQPTQRALGAVEPINRVVGRLTVEDYIRGPNGPLSLAASQPTADNHAAHKQYVDAGDQEAADELAAHDHAGGHILPDTIQQGTDLAETITETTSPSSFTFAAGEDRDILEVADVTLSNGTTASVTEDITVDLHDGADATAAVIATETKTVTVAAGATVTESFIAVDTPLGAGDYHIEVSQSGVDLSIDETGVQTAGGEYTWTQDAEGDSVITDNRGRERIRYDAVENLTEFPGRIESASASIGGRDAARFVSSAEGTRIERGVITGVSMPPASMDGTWDTWEFVDASVTFSTAFSATPTVFVAMNSIAGCIVQPQSATATGANFRVWNYSTSNRSTTTRDIYWMAVGGE